MLQKAQMAIFLTKFCWLVRDAACVGVIFFGFLAFLQGIYFFEFGEFIKVKGTATTAAKMWLIASVGTWVLHCILAPIPEDLIYDSMKVGK